ncbi:MAG: tetratricopeptide repeat protein [Bacteroidetes bacterium]|nr:tetratricopeptide repeat protein [Bacteroidota bacterium]
MKQCLTRLFILLLFLLTSVNYVKAGTAIQLPETIQKIMLNDEIEEKAEEILQSIDHYNLVNTYQAIAIGQATLPGIQDPAMRARITKSLAVAYYTSGNGMLADSLYFEALVIFDSLEMTQSKAEVFNNLGLMHYDRNGFEKALHYLHKAQEINQVIADTASLIKNLSNIALCYKKRGETKKALKELNHAYQLSETIKNNYLRALVLTNIGEVYHSMDNHQLEFEYYNMALSQIDSISNNYLRTNLHLNIAGNRLEMNRTHEAWYHLNMTRELAENYGFQKCLKDVYLHYSQYFSKTGNTHQAFAYYKKYHQLSDSIDQLSEANRIQAIHSKFEYENYLKHKEQQQNVAIHNEQLINRRTVLVISLSVILLLVLTLFTTLLFYSRKTIRLNRMLNTQKSELQELNQRKDEFFSFVAHDLKNPISNILGFSELMAQNLPGKEKSNLNRYSSQIKESAKSLNALIDNLLSWSRITRGKIKFEPEIIDLNSTVRDAIELYRKPAIKNEITIVNDIHDTIEVYADRDMTQTILKNLISNAVKFNRNLGHVYVTSAIYGNKVEIQIKDTGAGIKGEYISKLFRIDVKRSGIGQEQKNGGGGMGLILTREMVLKNNGDIYVESEYGKGSTFSFTLPLVTKEMKRLLGNSAYDINRYLDHIATYNSFPDELKQQIINHLLPRYQKIQKILSVDDLIHFSELIIQLGQQYHIRPLEDYGQELWKLTKELKFDKILTLLPQFDKISDFILTTEMKTQHT